MFMEILLSEVILVVKGISKQVIIVQSPEQKLFEQAIFILKEDAVGAGITDDMLMKEAQKVLRSGAKSREKELGNRPLWAVGGALFIGLLWLVCYLF